MLVSFHLPQECRNPKGITAGAVQAGCYPWSPTSSMTFVEPCGIFLSSHTGALRPSFRTASLRLLMYELPSHLRYPPQNARAHTDTGRSQFLHHTSFKAHVAEPPLSLCPHSKAYLPRGTSVQGQTSASLEGRNGFSWCFVAGRNYPGSTQMASWLPWLGNLFIHIHTHSARQPSNATLHTRVHTQRQ